jgi:hypothetical protein
MMYAQPCSLSDAPHPTRSLTAREVYDTLHRHTAGTAETKDWLQAQLAAAAERPCSLPDALDQLDDWMTAQHEAVGRAYADYLATRSTGGPRRYFSTRAHALAFLRGVAPTKLVDGSWLYGLVKHWRNPRLRDLIHTYLEELGEGRADRNHVLLYRQLLETTGITHWQDLPDDRYVQGALQLALAAHVEDLVPEVIGFNLGYEQLPLHLLITAYELNELGIDPYYFTLHTTVDNADNGHARRAVNAVREMVPLLGDVQEFWRRVRLGHALNDLGAGTLQVIGEFDAEAEVIALLRRKATVGQVMHSDYCRIAGRRINDWLADGREMPQFLKALQDTGWIKRNAPPSESRFWRLLDGDHAEMFGVFSSSELQLLQDWIRGDASRDGAPVASPGQRPAAPRSFRVQQRLRKAVAAPAADAIVLDPDAALLAFRQNIGSGADEEQMLVDLLAPAAHWTPAGLQATRRFMDLLTA